MNILALDTSTLEAALAVARADGRLFTSRTDPAVRHGRSLVPAIRDLMAEAGVSLAELNLIAVGLGPGSYTGLRIGVMAAKTLAYVFGTPLVGFDSLEPIALGAPGTARRVSVIADAQRGELYAAEFMRDTQGVLARSTETRVETLAGWLAGLVPETLVVGPALERLRVPLPAGVTRLETNLVAPQGHHLVPLAREALARGPQRDPWLLEPRYLRRSAAEDKWDAR